MAFGFKGFNLADGADFTGLLRGDAFPFVFQHGIGVQRDVRSRPCILGWGQVIGIGFTGHLEHRDGDFLRQFRLAGEPLTISPGLQNFLGILTVLGLFDHIVECVEYQEGFTQAGNGQIAHFGIIQ